MSNRFTALAFAATLLAASSWTASAQVPQAAGPLRIVDSTGKVVGPVVDLGGAPRPDGLAWTVMKVDNWRFRLRAQKFLLDTESVQRVLFESDDCSGTPLLEDQPLFINSFFDRVIVIGSRFSFYAPVTNAVLAPHAVRSARNHDDTCTASVGTITAIAVAKVVDIADHFAPPFALQEAPLAPATVASVPMLASPALIGLSALLAALAVVMLARRQRSRS